MPTPTDGPLPGGRGWRGDRFGLRLTSGETLWLGPTPRPRRALVRLAGERVALAAEAALIRVADARADDNYALWSACANGHLEVARWLADRFGLGPADARAG